VVACLGVFAPAAHAAPPSDPDCAALGAGSTGILIAGGSVPAASAGGGFGAPVADAALPAAVRLKTATATFSNEYAFLVRDGRMLVRRARRGVAYPDKPWHELALPACLDGHVRAISADHRLLVAVRDDGRLYAHDMPGGDISPERWTWRWGPYFWTGQGLTMFADVQRFAASEFTSAERFADSAGREHNPIGVATVYLLRGDGRRITYLDPWLPADESREICGPRRGTVPLAGLSGSGSTVFVVSRRGELFTRLYDFDVSGANTVFGAYTWQQVPDGDTRWQLPGPGWVRHRRPPRPITDQITLVKTGPHARDRLLVVEGFDRRGRRGVWRTPMSRTAWKFVRLGGGAVGRRLPLPSTPFAPDDHRYAGPIGEVADFNPECSPAHLHVPVAPGRSADLILHTSDGLRQETRAHGLDDTPREYNGAIEVPAAAWADPQVRAWADANLGGRRIATAPVAVTTTRLRFLAQCWELTRDGAPARPDVPRVPPDLGAIFARETERQQDGRPPSSC